MIDAYDLNDPDPEKRELASVQLVDDLFGPGRSTKEMIRTIALDSGAVSFPL